MDVEMLPVDLIEVVSVVMGCLIAIIPLFGLLIRFAARPLVDALVASRGDGAKPADIDALKMRVEALEHEVRTLAESPMQRRLRASTAGEPLPLRP
jgi:cell division protein FtsB